MKMLALALEKAENKKRKLVYQDHLVTLYLHENWIHIRVNGHLVGQLSLFRIVKGETEPMLLGIERDDHREAVEKALRSEVLCVILMNYLIGG
jgi:hypothetical protein